ncbi:hypothetical protein [Paenibacillus koleovorans]|uniref:hypothetical protein n=1 Tax=Paenibacillus koleovorans TaxID=121608 RepID=UPI000FD75E93|nr:hypothetical protein [Paenibacillus koleovorans]
MLKFTFCSFNRLKIASREAPSFGVDAADGAVDVVAVGVGVGSDEDVCVGVGVEAAVGEGVINPLGYGDGHEDSFRGVVGEGDGWKVGTIVWLGVLLDSGPSHLTSSKRSIARDNRLSIIWHLELVVLQFYTYITILVFRLLVILVRAR